MKTPKVIDITPDKFKCVAGACPAVYAMPDNQHIAIVGKKISANKLNISQKVGEDEQVVIVEREMISQLFNE